MTTPTVTVARRFVAPFGAIHAIPVKVACQSPANFHLWHIFSKSPRWDGAVLAGRSQVLGEPVGRRAGRALELIGVGGELTARVQLEPLGLTGAVERVEREIRRADDVALTDNHQQRRRPDPLDE